jgi:hypothetical protein
VKRLAVGLLLLAAPAWASELAHRPEPAAVFPDLARSDSPRGDEPYVLVQWLGENETPSDAGLIGNAYSQMEEAVLPDGR